MGSPGGLLRHHDLLNGLVSDGFSNLVLIPFLIADSLIVPFIPSQEEEPGRDSKQDLIEVIGSPVLIKYSENNDSRVDNGHD